MTPKRKILTAIQIIALLAAIIGTVSLFYNAIQLFVYSVANEKFQKSEAIITLTAAIVSIAGVMAGIASLFNKDNFYQIFGIIVFLIVIFALIGIMIASNLVWLNYANFDKGIPYDVHKDVGIERAFTLYSSLSTIFLQQLVYFLIFAIPLIINFVTEGKGVKVQAEQPAEIPAENIIKTDKE